MLEEQTPSVSDAPESGSTEEGLKDVVSAATHKKLLSQRKSDQEKMRSLQEQLDNFNQEKQGLEQKKLEEQGEYKKALELYKARVEEKEKDNAMLAGELTTTWKKQAFFSKLKGQLKRPEFENFIDFNSIALDPETKEVDYETVDMAVNNFMENYGDLVALSTAKTIPGNAPSATGIILDYSEAIKKCKTQSEFDKVRREYGKSDR